eukprot:CAMPEP_0172655192 /NCGR_PEP_ID=MMETSP1074-20121228/478_1 /TAXON_ID=2916 /ORGANISM="Ceratium fusus, Strain PA161109" /LENGTH=78 /DNA_ID=CAMNT_0013469759 /DNA_START=225 /DNA_END=461 /DNA_ORIENTATION=+
MPVVWRHHHWVDGKVWERTLLRKDQVHPLRKEATMEGYHASMPVCNCVELRHKIRGDLARSIYRRRGEVTHKKQQLLR